MGRTEWKVIHHQEILIREERSLLLLLFLFLQVTIKVLLRLRGWWRCAMHLLRVSQWMVAGPRMEFCDGNTNEVSGKVSAARIPSTNRDGENVIRFAAAAGEEEERATRKKWRRSILCTVQG